MNVHDEDADRDLRRMRQAFREEVEEAEAVAAEFLASQRALVDVVVDAGMEGTEVTVELPQLQLVGAVTHVGESVFTLLSPSGVTTLIVIDQIVGLRVGSRRSNSGRVERSYPQSLVAALRGAVAERSRLAVERTSGPTLIGDIDAVSVTHAQLRDKAGAVWHVPLRAITAVRDSSTT
ncbi:MAG: hypothetical protein R2706_16435 [Acidimicrobiales bacterium]